MAKRYWPNVDPVGQRLKTGAAQSQGAWLMVVGVVRDVKTRGPEKETPAEVFLPYKQTPPLWMTLVVRTSISPTTFTKALDEQVRSVDLDLPLYRTRTMNEVLSSTIAQRRFAMLVLSVFAALALTRYMSGMLFGVSPTDPTTFFSVALILVVAALPACWIPALRAASVDPIVTLRHER